MRKITIIIIKRTERNKTYLVFSGGHTRPRDVTARSEAESYYDAMLEILREEQEERLKREDGEDGEDGENKEDRARGKREQVSPETTTRNVLIEDFATDSFQNLLFSILKYARVAGTWPDHITVVTHEFKRKRFLVCISLQLLE